MCVASGAFFLLLSFGLFLSFFVKVELGCCPVWSPWFAGHVAIGYQLDSSVQCESQMFNDVLLCCLLMFFLIDLFASILSG